MNIEDEFVEKLKEILGPNVKKISEVDWSTVSQDALDNDTFVDGEPFFLVAPQEYWTVMRMTPAFMRICRCLDINGRPIPNCIPKDHFYPFRAAICLDIANPTNFNDMRGRACVRQGESWHQLTCFCPCL